MSRGRQGGGQSRKPYPHPRHAEPRHGAGGASERPPVPSRAAAEGAALGPSAAYSGNFCGRGAAGKDTAAPGPPVPMTAAARSPPREEE